MELKPDVEALFEFIGYRKEHIFEGYRPAHLLQEGYLTTGLHHYNNMDKVEDCKIKGTITFLSPDKYPGCLWIGKKIKMYEGRKLVGYATIINIFNSILQKTEI